MIQDRNWPRRQSVSDVTVGSFGDRRRFRWLTVLYVN
jgi:hypothetical protein